MALAIAVIVGGAIAIVVELASGGGAAQPAGPTLFISPSGAPGRACSKTQPCQSFDDAYRKASPGATVLVESGSYPGQIVNRDSTKPSGGCDGYTLGAALDRCITFQPDAGASVTFTGGIQILGDGVQLNGFGLGGNALTIGDCNATTLTTNVVARKITGSSLQIQRASYFGDLGGNWGPLPGSQIVYVTGCGGSATLEPTHIRFDGGTYHDAIQEADGQHLECIHVEPADYVTIRNSVFRNCAQHDIALGGSGGEPETHFLIENNVLPFPCSEQSSVCQPNDPIDSSCSGGPHSDWTVRFNSMEGQMYPNESTGCTYTGTNVYYGNVETGPMTAYQCSQWAAYGWTRSYNVGGPGGVTCGTGSIIGTTLTSPRPPAYDYRPIARNVGVGLVPLALGAPQSDIVGNRRPPRSNTDAGAYQWDPVQIVLGRSIGAVKLSGSIADVLDFYGQPRSRHTFRSGTKRPQRLTFRVHGGTLWVIGDNGAVVGVGTTSPYYATVGNVGVKGDASSIKSWRGATWSDCGKAFYGRYGGVGVYIAPAGGQRGKTLASIAMVQTGYAYGRCQPAG